MGFEQLEDRVLPSTAAPDFVSLPLHSGAAPAAGSALVAPYSPAEVAAAYGINGIVFSGGVKGNGAGQTIAIVDAYGDPGAANDLAAFDARFGLPNPPNFEQLNEKNQTTNLPRTDPTGGWEIEESLDIEWAHAFAPAASIVLVEANSSNFNDLFAAVQTAEKVPGVSVVSMSWGQQGGFRRETSDDSLFNVPGITFVASTGDSGSPGSYPAESPNVVAVGGTSLTLTSTTAYGNETAWSGSGGGASSFEARPSFQNGVSSIVGSQRGTPDVAFDGNPNTGVWVYDSSASNGPWLGIGGTSFGAPSWAALFAVADQGRASAGLGNLSSAQTLSLLYSLPANDFHDITSGSNGGYAAGVGYDLVTGLGTPVANLLVPALAGVSPSAVGLTGDYEVMQFAGAGIYRFNNGTNAWTQLSASSNATSLAVDAYGNVVADFSGAGVWLYQTATATWTQLSAVDVSQVAIAGNEMVAGAFSYGVYRWQPTTGWIQLTSNVATSLAIDANSDVVANFPGLGVQRFENSTGWQTLTTSQASQVAIAGNGIVAAIFGTGLYRWEDSTGFVQLSTNTATSISVDANGDVAASITGLGVWRFTDRNGWSLLSSTISSEVAIGFNGQLLATFATGVYLFNPATGWELLSNSSANLIAAGN